MNVNVDRTLKNRIAGVADVLSDRHRSCEHHVGNQDGADRGECRTDQSKGPDRHPEARTTHRPTTLIQKALSLDPHSGGVTAVDERRLDRVWRPDDPEEA